VESCSYCGEANVFELLERSERQKKMYFGCMKQFTSSEMAPWDRPGYDFFAPIPEKPSLCPWRPSFAVEDVFGGTPIAPPVSLLRRCIEEFESRAAEERRRVRDC